MAGGWETQDPEVGACWARGPGSPGQRSAGSRRGQRARGQALGGAEVSGLRKTVRVGEGWRTAGRTSLEVCLGTEMGQLCSVHLTGLWGGG